MAIGDIVDLDEVLKGYTPLVEPQFSPEVTREAVKDLNYFEGPSQEEIARQLYGIEPMSAPSTTFGDIGVKIALGPLYGLLNKESPPVDIVKDANLLPADQKESGQKALLLEFYKDKTLNELDPRIDPITNRMTYVRPEDGKRIYINAPGVDLADLKTEFLEPLAVDMVGAIGGFALGSKALEGGRLERGAGALLSYMFGANVAENLGLGTAGQVATGATTGALGAVAPRVTLTAEGAFLTHLLWKKANLEGLRERGILDESYTDDKILLKAMEEAAIVGGAEVAGGTLFAGLSKLIGATPLSIGVSKEQFDNALNTVRNMRKEAKTPQEKEALESLTTPEVLEIGGVGVADDAPLADLTGVMAGKFQVGYMKDAIERIGQSMDPKVSTVYDDLIIKQNQRNQNVSTFFEQTGVDPKLFKDIDVTKAKQIFGQELMRFSGKSLKNATASEKKLVKVINASKGEPELLFNSVWKPNSLSLTQGLLNKLTKNGDVAGIDTFKSLVYRDFIDQTKVNGQFTTGKLDEYMRQYNSALTELYGKEMTDGLNNYITLLKKLDTGSIKIPEASQSSMKKMVNDLVRAYVGIFTREGRIVTALGRSTDRIKLGKYEELILDPDKLEKALRNRELLDDPKFRLFVRGLARGYGQQFATDDEEDTIYTDTALVEEQDRVNLELLDSILAEQ